MLNFLPDIIAPILIAAGVSIIGVIIKPGADAAINVMKTKKEEIEQSKFIRNHQHQIELAREIWGKVDEEFRISQTIENVTESKAKMFDEYLLKKIPGLTQEELDDLRQTIAGEVNKGKQALQDDVVKQLQ